MTRRATTVEAVIAEAWREVLRRTSWASTTTTSPLGGDSITMLQIRAAAEKRGVRFALADLVRNPTVAGLAERAAPGRA